MPVVRTEVRLSLAECKDAIILYLKELGYKNVKAQNVKFNSVITSGGHGDDGPPETRGCTVSFDEKTE